MKYRYNDEVTKVIVTECALYTYNQEKNWLKAEIHSSECNMENLIDDLNEQIQMYKPKAIAVKSISDLKQLEWLLNIIGKVNTKRKIILDLTKDIDGLDKKTKINVKSLPSNVSIHAVSSKDPSKGSNFMAYLHNSEDDIKYLFALYLDRKSTKTFDKEEKIIKEFYNGLLTYIPNFDELSDEVKFNTIYMFIRSYFRNTYTDLDNVEDSNSINVFENKRGNSFGLSRLLTILTNNSLVNIDSYAVLGNLSKGSKAQIGWNEVILNNDVYEYDIAYGIQEAKLEDLEDRTITERNKEIISLISNNKSHIYEKKCTELKPVKQNI